MTRIATVGSSRWRRAWVQVHLWLGLTLGVIGALIGLSGSVLVYDHEIDEALNPQRYAITAIHYALPFDEYVRRAAMAFGEGVRPVGIRLPDLDDGPILVFARAANGPTQRTYLDPGTGRVLDTAMGQDWLGFLHAFHESLALRDYNGREIVGVVGMAMLISSLSGLYLWWPARGTRAPFAFRRGRTLSRNLHYTFGFWGMVVLAVLSFTGAVIAFPDAARSVASWFGSVSPSPRGVRAAEGTGPSIGADEAIAIALNRFPNATPAGIGLPVGPRGAYRINVREIGDTDPRPATVVFIDPHTRAILQQADRNSRTAADRFLARQRPVHEGSMGGSVWRALVFVGGLLPALLMITGLMMWLAIRRRRGVARMRAATAAIADD
jgi:uncharacterized iron-regulated membrane protein